MEDRSAQSMPVSALNRMNYAPPTTKRYNDAATTGAAPLNRALTGDQENLPENIKEAIKNAPTKRFCGGTSKPYSKK